MKSTNNRRKFASAFFAAIMMIGILLVYPGSSKAEITPDKKKEPIAGSCAGDGSCIIVVRTATHSDNHALDRVIYN